MSEVTVIRRTVFFRAAGQSALAKPTDADRDEPVPNGRVPRVARLLALALRFEELVRAGVVADYAEVARLGRVSRARLTQIMNLLNLAPDIQEQLLFLPPTERGRDPIAERHLRPIAGVFDWRKQRRMWARLIRPANRHGLVGF